MTVKEILELQEITGDLYLLRQGLFYRGYGPAAAFLHDALGYKLMAKEVESCAGRLLYAGFPAGVLDKVSEVVTQRGGTITVDGGNAITITGITVEYDQPALFCAAAAIIKKKRVTPEKSAPGLAEQIATFDLTGSTPVDCMNFIAGLQERLSQAAL